MFDFECIENRKLHTISLYKDNLEPCILRELDCSFFKSATSLRIGSETEPRSSNCIDFAVFLMFNFELVQTLLPKFGHSITRVS